VGYTGRGGADTDIVGGDANWGMVLFASGAEKSSTGQYRRMVGRTDICGEVNNRACGIQTRCLKVSDCGERRRRRKYLVEDKRASRILGLDEA
jgi:hypothetical protein